MVIHWGRPIPGWALFAVLAAICSAWIFLPPKSQPAHFSAYQTIYNPVGDSPLNDSLPHYLYQRREDSIKSAEVQQDYFSRRGSSEFGFLGLGATSVSINGKSEYLLSALGYRLEEHVSVNNKKSRTLIRFPVWDRIKDDTRSGHLESRRTNVKYTEGKEAWEGKVYVVTTKPWGNVANCLLIVLAVMVGVIGFYAALFVPARFLWQLSKGRAFTEENIGSLYLTGWTLVFIGAITALVKIIFRLIFQSQIPEGIEFSYYAAAMSGSTIMAAGLAVLLVAKAFLQGLELKEEQDLTV